jgi:hypothetical protein
MAATHTGIEDAELDGGLFGRMIFQWQGDRYTHSWLCCETGEKLLESVESDHAVHWPNSPPLQQVYRQTFDDGRDVMFGVGMSGRGHWSASFSLVPDLKSWIMELACCSPATPHSLASTYRLLGSWRLVENAPSGQYLVCLSGGAELRLEPLSSQTRLILDPQALVPERRGAIAPELRIEPESLCEGAATTQWGFRLRIGEASREV